MEKIKFSHNYPKLKNNRHAYLLNVSTIVTDDKFFSSMLYEYDTTYYDREGNKRNYPLINNMNYLLLLFLGEDGSLFTTIRKYEFKKHYYYQQRINNLFEIEVDEEDYLGEIK